MHIFILTSSLKSDRWLRPWADCEPIWATFEHFGRTLRVGAPELHFDLKLRVTGTRNRHEKVGHERGTYPYDFPMGALTVIFSQCTSEKKLNGLDHR